MLHQRGGIDKKKHEEANLLGFKGQDSKAAEKAKEIKFKDEEAMDFGWFVALKTHILGTFQITTRSRISKRVN